MDENCFVKKINTEEVERFKFKNRCKLINETLSPQKKSTGGVTMTIEHKKSRTNGTQVAARRPVRIKNKKCIALPREEISNDNIEGVSHITCAFTLYDTRLH